LLFDTNIFIYHLNAEPHVEDLFSGDFLSANNIYYSIITEIELLSFPKLSEEENKIIKGLLEKFLPISLTEEVKEKTIEIKKNLKIGDSRCGYCRHCSCTKRFFSYQRRNRFQ